MSIEIKRSDKYIDYNISAANNRGYITIDTSDWINKPWMFYELPALKFEIYTETDGELVKYQNFSREIRTYNPVYSPLGVLNVTVDIRNVPEEFILRITPIFDNNAVAARNMLIENGIEDGDIWGSDQDVPTQLFNLNIEFIECDGEYVPPTPPVPPTHEETITGVTPITFDGSTGEPLVSWTILGNGSQSGTPSPDNILMPTFCGVRTGNLWGEDYTGISASLKYVPVYVGNADVTMSTTCQRTSGGASIFLLSGNVSSGAATNTNGVWAKTGSYVETSRTASPIDGYVTVAFRTMTESGREYTPANANSMLNSGSTVLPYEPYGYKIPITNAGQTIPVYLGEVPTVRRVRKVVFDGTEGWSENTSGENTFRAILVLSQANINRTDGYCSHLPFVATGISQDRPLAGCFNSAAFLRFDRTMVNNITEFKSYLKQQYAAGTPVTVWYVLAEPSTAIVNEPLAKIGDYADELSSEDAAVTIPTVKGSNTLTVDTPIQPSEMTITYIKEGQ